ncbi:MAG TPA: glycosyl hydrolase family 28 protein [Humisphaera sp.]|jgi:polygalacturonase|nr:glycosyl hydrolase family 28 protein [Humisphaera sp.]
MICHLRLVLAVLCVSLLLAAQTFSAEPLPPADNITAALPQIPDAKFNLADFGAIGDGRTLNTDAFKSAVAAIAKAGGGHLIVPAGTFKTLPFVLTSHMDLHLDAAAAIKAPDTFAEYGIPDPNLSLPENAAQPGRGVGGPRVAPLISCPNGTTDLAITGPGTIDGSGSMFWIWSDKAARKYPPGRRIIARPHLIVLSGVSRLHVDGVTLTNSPMFHLVPSGQDMTIENIRVVAPSDAPNTDAIDPAGQRIVIRKCEIDTGDDNVALHSGSRDVLVEDLTCLHGHGISIGSPTRNGLSHVIVRRCTFSGTDNGLRIKSYRGNGGEVHDIWYSDITMKNVRRPFDINMLYNGNSGGPTDVGPRQAAAGQTQAIPNFHDIHVTNLTVNGGKIAGRILGLPEQMASNFTFTNVKVQTTRGFLVQDAKDITFEDVQIQAATGEPLVIDNATVKWNGETKSGSSGGSPVPFY